MGRTRMGRTDGRTDGLTDGRTDGRTRRRLYAPPKFFGKHNKPFEAVVIHKHFKRRRCAIWTTKLFFNVRPLSTAKVVHDKRFK